MELIHLKIDKSVFEKILRDKLSDDTIEILKIEHRCLSEKGLNFLSELYDVSVIYKSKKNTKTECSFDVIIKTEPINNASRSYLHEQNLFSFELRCVRDVLPRIMKYVHCQLAPRLFYGSAQPPVLIMENLRKKGYILKNRQKGLPFEHCRVAIECIAKMHAGSVAVFEKEPELIEYFKDGGLISQTNPENFLHLSISSLTRMSSQIEQWPNEWCASVAKKLMKLTTTMEKRFGNIYDCDADEFRVLNHGDYWINNMLFKENEKGEPVDLQIVDYQMTVFSSPAFDLLYFLLVCPEFDIRYDKDDYFLKLYLDTLKETMKDIGCKRKPPTMEQLKAAMHKRKTFAVLAGLVFAFRMLANKEDIEEFKDRPSTAGTKMDVFKNPDAIKLAHKLLPIMDAKGCLD
ncbi:unnamed protein product [Xylocopa violacea]|uniref:CHK kinase-like domain-containing protein n=1 Tax=Xylocopa violacea TaxID=135666 RepID=A0ABP1NVC2_XYLVO